MTERPKSIRSKARPIGLDMMECKRGHRYHIKEKKCPKCAVIIERKHRMKYKRANAEIFGRSAAASRYAWIPKAKETMQRFMACFMKHPDGHWVIKKEMWPEMLEVKDMFDVLLHTELQTGTKRVKKLKEGEQK